MFKTDKTSCIDFNSSDLPIDLNDANSNSTGITISEVSVPYDAPIVDLKVLVNIEHSWLEDLTLYLESPDGVKIILSKQIGGSGNNYSETLFDQDSNNNIFNASPPFSGSYIPVQSLETFYNKNAFGKWKLITSKNDLDEGKQTELYNIDQDPYEKNNLAKTYPERTLQLLTMIKKEYSCDYLSVRKDLDRFTDPLSAQITS